MIRPRSIRFRLTVWYAGILIAGLGLFGGLLWLTLRHQLYSDFDHSLAERASHFENYFRQESQEDGIDLKDELEEFCQALPQGSFIRLHGTNGFEFRYPNSDVTLSPRFRTIARQFSTEKGTFVLEAGAPIADILHTLELVGLLLIGLIPVVIAIACVGGAWLSGRALKPVEDLTAAALKISIENLSERLPVPTTEDELARLTQVLNSMLARLESAVKTLSQFVGDASHELRTPLAVIRTTAELALRRGRASESYQESLQAIAAETERMTQLVEDLLTIACSDAEVAEMPKTAIDVRLIVRDVCSELKNLAETRQIRIKTSLEEDDAIVSGNRPALHRLFLVLLDNALKYSLPGGEVFVTTTSRGSRVEIAVEDWGIGISQDDLPHIFERFYRADRARSGDGHGLGLSLAQSIARAHGGALEVQRKSGAGTIFRVVLPTRGELRMKPEVPEKSSVSARV